MQRYRNLLLLGALLIVIAISAVLIAHSRVTPSPGSSNAATVDAAYMRQFTPLAKPLQDLGVQLSSSGATCRSPSGSTASSVKQQCSRYAKSRNYPATADFLAKWQAGSPAFEQTLLSYGWHYTGGSVGDTGGSIGQLFSAPAGTVGNVERNYSKLDGLTACSLSLVDSTITPGVGNTLYVTQSCELDV